MATLVLNLQDREIQRLPITDVVTTIGRDPECHMCIDNAGVSRSHARVEYSDDDGFRVVDTSSSNGISMGGRVVRTAWLRDQDSFSFGKFTVTFLESGGAALAKLSAERLDRGDLNDISEETMHLPPEYLEKLRAAKRQRQHDRDTYRMREIELQLRTASQRNLLVVLSLGVMALTGVVLYLMLTR